MALRTHLFRSVGLVSSSSRRANRVARFAAETACHPDQADGARGTAQLPIAWLTGIWHFSTAVERWTVLSAAASRRPRSVWPRIPSATPSVAKAFDNRSLSAEVKRYQAAALRQCSGATRGARSSFRSKPWQMRKLIRWQFCGAESERARLGCVQPIAPLILGVVFE